MPPRPGSAADKARRGLIDARGPGPWQVVGGIPLVTRLVRSLELEGIEAIDVLWDRADGVASLGARAAATKLTLVPLAPGECPAGAVARSAGAGLLLAVDGALVVDRRLLAAVAAAGAPCVVPPPDAGPVGLALLDAASAPRFAAALPPPEAFARLLPEQLPTFSREMRGETPLIYRAARTPASARDAERALVTATQKHVMDAPARWIDPPIENAIVLLLAPTRVTPNHVTVVATFLGFVGALLLWTGAFAIALPVLYLVGWLDGVDGKLARLRLHYSPLGAGESYFDFAYENAWWIALAAHFANAGAQDAVCFGVALVAGNLVDEIAYTIGHARLGLPLDLLSPADGAFRLIAGRRNVYVAMLLVATLLGSPYAGLVAMGVWAVVTGGAHTLRLLVALRGPASPRLPA